MKTKNELARQQSTNVLAEYLKKNTDELKEN